MTQIQDMLVLTLVNYVLRKVREWLRMPKELCANVMEMEVMLALAHVNFVWARGRGGFPIRKLGNVFVIKDTLGLIHAHCAHQ